MEFLNFVPLIPCHFKFKSKIKSFTGYTALYYCYEKGNSISLYCNKSSNNIDTSTISRFVKKNVFLFLQVVNM